MALPSINGNVTNPFTGVFGTGQVQVFAASGTFNVPLGITKCRARVWGGGGYNYGGGGGFSMKEVDLAGASTVAVTVGAGGISSSTTGGTSSFGSHCSATGGGTAGAAGGSGTGGDVNHTGGTGDNNGGGGGCAGLFGNGGNSATSGNDPGKSGNSGGSAGITSGATKVGGNGFFGQGGTTGGITTQSLVRPATTGFESGAGLDAVGTGGGGDYRMPGSNGGGSGYDAIGVRPGGGGGSNNQDGGPGLVIVEY